MSTERYIWWDLSGEKCEAVIYARSRFNPRLVAYRLEPCKSTKGKKGKPHIGVTTTLRGRPALLTVHPVGRVAHAAAMVEAAPRSLVRMIMAAAALGTQTYAAKEAGTYAQPPEDEAQRRLELRTRIYSRLRTLESETDPDTVMVNVRGIPGFQALNKGLGDLVALREKHQKEMEELRARQEAAFRQASDKVTQLAVPAMNGLAQRIETASGMKTVAGRPGERGMFARFAYAALYIRAGGAWREVEVTIGVEHGLNLRYPSASSNVASWARSSVDLNSSGRLKLDLRSVKSARTVAAPAGAPELPPKDGQLSLV